MGAAGSSIGSPIGSIRPVSRIALLLALISFPRDVNEIVVLATLLMKVAAKKTKQRRSTAFQFNLSPPLCFYPQTQ